MKHYFIFSILFLSVKLLFSITPVQFKVGEKPFMIGKNIEYYEDSSHSKPFEDILSIQRTDPSKFIQHDKEVANFGLTKSYFWIHFKINNLSNENNLLLDVAQPLTNVIELYTLNPDGTYNIRAMGDLKPFDERDYSFPAFIFKLNIKPDSTVEYFLKVVNYEQQQLPIYVGTYDAIIKKNINAETLIAIYIGIVVVMFLYNLFLFFSIRDRSYAYYVIYILIIGITQLALFGYAYKFLWPDYPWLQNNATYIFSSLTGVFLSLFAQVFLSTKTVLPRFHKAISVGIVGYVLCMPVAVVFHYYILGYFMLQVLGMYAALVGLIVAIISIGKKVASAKYFLIAWISFLLGLMIFISKDVGLIPFNIYTLYTLPAGSAVEMVLISFALANRINILKREKEESQLIALRAAEENERLVSEQNVILESEVKERTKDLQHAMQELKRSEAELVNREKMSSLGLLTAGIAHEINNPINFVSASVTPLKRDIEEISGLLKEYGSMQEEGGFNAARYAEIERKKEEMDTPYLLEEIGMLLDGIEDGATRTANIVRGLQKFSRSDEHFMKNSDLTDGLENTLVLLGSQIKDQITIHREYQPIPFLDCSPGKLNQVFLNILSNAIYAVNHSNKSEKIITLKTYLKEQVIYICIRDNGIGIPKSEQEKIFDPFYTTKEVGKGTGLGLSISYGIIKDHKGEITFESTPGEGTEFIIKLPILEGNET